MWRWKRIPLVVALGLATPVGAQEAPDATPVLPGLQAHRGVIDDTWIIAPKHLGNATLVAVKNYADEGDIAAGVSLRYRIDHAEWIAADVFIYPAGDGAPTDMLKRAAEDFRESVAFAERQEIYRNVWWGDTSPYVARLANGKTLEGRFLPLVFDAQQDMLTSRTYLFYRKLYFTKIRLTTPVGAVDSLNDNADRFVRNLLDGVDVVSEGGCGKKMDISVLASGQSPPPDMADGVSADGFHVMLPTGKAGLPAYGPAMEKTLALAAKRQLATGCTSLDYHPPLQDDTRTVLHLSFQASDWGAAPKQ
ncbi:hypothetical protein P3W24_00455 [Luteibacter sp. PPL201]|uniref:DUF4852 domain-containing protein n=1 Tax=Luteibacter sahnii TaxID=3021977 RepID=A0ABT6B5P0_9GAMM